MFVIQGMAKCNVCRAEIGVDVEFSFAHMREFKYGYPPVVKGIESIGRIRNICYGCVSEINQAFEEILRKSTYATDEEKSKRSVWL